MTESSTQYFLQKFFNLNHFKLFFLSNTLKIKGLHDFPTKNINLIFKQLALNKEIEDFVSYIS